MCREQPIHALPQIQPPGARFIKVAGALCSTLPHHLAENRFHAARFRSHRTNLDDLNCSNADAAFYQPPPSIPPCIASRSHARANVQCRFAVARRNPQQNAPLPPATAPQKRPSPPAWPSARPLSPACPMPRSNPAVPPPTRKEARSPANPHPEAISPPRHRAATPSFSRRA